MAGPGYSNPGCGFEAPACRTITTPILKNYRRLQTLRHWLDGTNGGKASNRRFDLAYKRIATLEDYILSQSSTGPFDTIAKMLTAATAGFPLTTDDEISVIILSEAATLLRQEAL